MHAAAAGTAHRRQCRLEILRAAGHSYRDLEDAGTMLVVVEVHIRYLGPARFDDLLTLRTTTERFRGTRIDHHYHVLKDDKIIVDATTTVACVSRQGRPQRLPDWLLDAPVALCKGNSLLDCIVGKEFSGMGGF